MKAALPLLTCAAVFTAGLTLARLRRREPASGPAPPAAVSETPLAPAVPAPELPKTAAEKFLAKCRETAGAKAADCRRLFLTGLEETDAALCQAAAQRWAELAPADFWHWIGGLNQREFELHKPEIMAAQITLLREWVRRDPDAAVAAVSTAAPLLHLSAACGEVFQALLLTAPEKAFAMAARFTRMDVAWGLDSAVWKDDPARFARAAGALPSGPVRDWIKDKALYDAAILWHQREPAAALAWIRTLNPAEQCFFLPKVLHDLASRDFPAALRLAESLPRSMPQEAAGVELVELWAGTDAAAALAWADANLQSRRLQSYDLIMDSAVAANVQSAAGIAAALPTGNGRDRAISRVAWQWSKNDADAAMDWVATLPADSARRAAFSAMGGDWVARNPGKAAGWMQAAPAAEVPDFLVHRAARQLALQEPANAIKWAASMPEEHRVTAMRGVVGQLVWTSPQPDFAPLLAKLPAPQQQLAINSMVDNWAFSCQGPQPAWVGTLTTAQRAAARRRIQNYSFLDAGDRRQLLNALE